MPSQTFIFPIHAMRLRACGLVSMSLLTQGLAEAQTAHDSYYYGGLSYGESEAPMNSARIANQVLDGNTALPNMKDDDRGRAYKILGGYQFTRNLGLELSYFNLGKYSFHADTVPTGTIQGVIKVQGYAFDAVGTWPLSERFSVLGRLGAQYARTNDNFSATGAATLNQTQSRGHQNNIKYGVGVQYEFSPSLLGRIEMERFRLSDGVGDNGRVNAFTVGLVIPIGRAPKPALRIAEASRYTAPDMATITPEPVLPPAPTPPPIVLAPAAGSVHHRVSYSADTLFPFDDASIKSEGKAALDHFIDEVKGSQYEEIKVEGHTDRLGRTAYNQTLSEQRAAAVKSYLVEMGKIDAAHITATGKSESNPVTKAGDCKSSLRRAALIACLQPDRRVDIDVVGER